MKVTKKAKTATVVVKEVVEHRHIVTYTCPACKITFVGASVANNVTRFKCECGQELIVQRLKIKE